MTHDDVNPDNPSTARPEPALPFADPAPSRVSSPAERLEQARAELTRHVEIGALVTRAREQLAAARAHRAQFARRAEDESADVERLEGASVSSLWSHVRGRYEQDLARETDEAAQARSELAAADAQVAAARAELDRLLDSADELVDARNREQAALEDLARGPELWDGQDEGQVAQARAELRRRQTVRDLDAATSTARHLLGTLDHVSGMVRWTGFAAWSDASDLGSGSAKYRRLDELRPHLQAINDGLAVLASHPAVVDAGASYGLAPIAVPAADRFVRAVDTWLDDRATDDAVWREVRQVGADTQRVRGAVEGVVAELSRRRSVIASA